MCVRRQGPVVGRPPGLRWGIVRASRPQASPALVSPEPGPTRATALGSLRTKDVPARQTDLNRLVETNAHNPGSRIRSPATVPRLSPDIALRLSRNRSGQIRSLGIGLLRSQSAPRLNRSGRTPSPAIVRHRSLSGPHPRQNGRIRSRGIGLRHSQNVRRRNPSAPTRSLAIVLLRSRNVPIRNRSVRSQAIVLLRSPSARHRNPSARLRRPITVLHRSPITGRRRSRSPSVRRLSRTTVLRRNSGHSLRRSVRLHRRRGLLLKCVPRLLRSVMLLLRGTSRRRRTSSTHSNRQQRPRHPRGLILFRSCYRLCVARFRNTVNSGTPSRISAVPISEFRKFSA